MPDRSEEESLEAELGLDEDAASGSATDSSDEVDLDALEAELGVSDGSGEETGTVGLDRDPSEQYADLVDDAPATGGDRGTPARDTGDEAGNDDGGLLSRLFGGSDDASVAAESAGERRDDPVDGTAGSDQLEPEAGPTGAADDLLEGLDDPVSTDPGPASDRQSEPDGTEATADDGLRARLAAHFSPRALLAAALTIAVLAGLGRTFVPLIGGPAGIAGAGFLLGLAGLRYRELAVAAVIVGAVGAFAGGVSVAFATGATERLLAVGAVGGLVLSLVGAYFGTDLRAGLVGGDEDWSEPEP